ncbi:Amyloid beta A4 protein, partial [Orchesella cincta]
KVKPTFKMEWIFLKTYLYFAVIVSCVNSQLDFGDGWNGGGRFGKRLSAHGYGPSGQGQGSGQQGGQQTFGGAQQGGQSFGGGGPQQGGQSFGGGGQQGGQQSNQQSFGGGGQMQGPGQQKPRPQLVPQSKVKNKITIEFASKFCVTQTGVCVLKADPGYCNLIIGRWYYDFRYHRCLPFLYTGCGGNTNNFISPKSCDAATRTCHLSPTSYMPLPLRSHDPITQSRLFGAH